MNRRLLNIVLTLALGPPFTLSGVLGPRTTHAADGDLDTTKVDGKLTTDFGGREYATGAAIRPDGKIVVARLCRAACLSQLIPNGSLASLTM
jgi:hypothetical protein